MGRGAITAALALIPALSSAEVIECRTASGAGLRVALAQDAGRGLRLHCVEGLDIGPVAACAPQGGWGVSDSEGRLSAVTTDPHEVATTGGVFWARLGPTEFVASAAVGARPLALEVAGATVWRMRLTLATGRGIMATRAGEEEVVCGAAAP